MVSPKLYIFCMIFFFADSVSYALSGSGSEIDPYIIANRADFDEFRSNEAYWALGVHTRLDADIDLRNTIYAQAPIAPDLVHNSFNYNGTPYSGNFDGNRHKIIGLRIASYNRDFIGLIGKLYRGTIENLGLEDCHIVADTTGDNTFYHGTLCGQVYWSTIRGCYTTGIIRGDRNTGGFCGYSTATTTIENCYSLVKVYADDWNSGGFCGTMSSGTLTNCYSAGLTGLSINDGFIGTYHTGTVTGCFWDTEVSLVKTSLVGFGKTTEEMRSQSTFAEAGWSFVDGTSGIWKMSHASGNNNGYPILAWQTDNPDYSLNGSGTEADPFVIDSRADFDAFCANPNFWNDYVTLETNLNLAGTTYTQAPIAPDPKAYASYLYVYGDAFTGSFNGNGHTISGLTINGGGKDHLGLFGCIRRAKVTNLNISGCNISGNNDVIGGLCGAFVGPRSTYEGYLSNCSVTGTITGSATESEKVGGLCGYVYDTDMVSNCHADVTVSGKSNVGGLVGYISGGDGIMDCSSSGTVSGDNAIGGLFGYQSSRTKYCNTSANVSGRYSVGGFCGFTSGSEFWQLTIEKCYATGNVICTENKAGGFCGTNQGPIYDCYATGNVSGANDNIGGFCGWAWSSNLIRCYAAGDVNPQAGTIKSAGFCGHFDTSYGGTIEDCFWNTQTSGMSAGYTRYDSTTGQYLPHGSETGICVGLTTAQMQQQASFAAAGWDFVGETTNGQDDIWEMPALSVNNGFPVLVMPEAPLAGSGTAADPYVIDNRAKFDIYIAEPMYWGAYVRLDCHLDLSDTSYTASPIASDNSTEADFQGMKFTGNFNGNRRRITGLTINQPAKNYIGLFGCIDSGAQVYDLDVRGSLNGQMYVGGLCGHNAGLIQRCSASGVVIGNGHVGGFVGFNAGDIRTSCCNSQIDGYDYIGGFVGENHYYGGSIVNSYAVGEMLSYDLGAGFVGLNGGSIRNCYAAVNPMTDGLLVGAFCGEQDTANPGYFSITGCYYDSSTGTDLHATAATPSELTTRQTFVGWDFTGSYKDGIQNLWHMPFWTNQSRPIQSWQIDVMDIMENWLTAETSCDLNGDQTANLLDFTIHTTE
ncbi:MAG: hypothetical protein JEZ07_18345 [Phycisphaerae bacterium]|nr:hypothetical protein [Phycisphaerae bacterium]